MRNDYPWVSWRHALLACQADHPELFKHHPPATPAYETLEALLREAGVDMSVPDGAPKFGGNLGPADC